MFPTSRHFVLEQIADGVYAAIALQGGAAQSNAGIVDLGDQTLIFDTFGTPKAAEDLRSVAERLTGRPATYLVNSHVHWDHWLGNQVFASDATIVSTQRTRRRMTTEAASDIERCIKNPAAIERQIRALEERLESESDERWRISLTISITRLCSELEALPTLTLRFPNQTFAGSMSIHGTRRTVELESSGGGHTSSDALLVLPAERIVFMGDLAFFECHPLLSDGNPQAWVRTLERLAETDLETFVPGHGPLGTKADITLQKRYILALEELAAQVAERGGSADQAAHIPVPAPFDAWSRGMPVFQANMRTLYRRLSGN